MHPVNSYADLTGSSCDQYTDMVKLKQFVQNGRSLAFGLLVDLLAMVLGVLFGCICMGSMPGFTPHSLYDDGPSQSVGSSFTDSVVAAANCLDTFTNASYHGPRELILAPILTVRLSSNYVTCESLDMLLKSSYELACYDSCSVTSVPCSDTMVESGSDYFENVFLKPIYILSEFHFPWDFGTAPRRRARTRVQSWNNSAALANLSISSIEFVVFYRTGNHPIVAEIYNLTRVSQTAHEAHSTRLWLSQLNEFPDIFLFITCGIILLIFISYIFLWRYTSWIHFAVVALALGSTGLRCFFNIATPAPSALNVLQRFPTPLDSSLMAVYTENIENLLFWLDMNSSLATAELWTLLFMTALLFTNFRVRAWHLVIIFALIFGSFGVIGWLSFGDLVPEFKTVWDVYLCQFGMISSNWPSELYLESRQLEFSIWLIANACVVFCGLYNFYQAMLEKEYSQTGWFMSGCVSHLRYFHTAMLLKEIETLRETEGELVPLAALRNCVEEKHFAFLVANGLIDLCSVRRRRKRRKRNGDRLEKLLLRSESVYNWLCTNFPRANSEYVLTDEDLILAIEKSFIEH